MSHTEQAEPIPRTSPRRLGKMLAIIIGIQVVGAAIFFTHYDYWTSYQPIAEKKLQGPSEREHPPVQATGKTISVSLKFVESPDLRILAFNSVSGPDHNPEIHANVGDKLVFDVANAGKSYHAFAVTSSKEGPGPAIDGTTIGTADNPMKPRLSGQATFVPSQPGEYYYICAVPGHRELGMEGKIEVAPSGGAAQPSGAEVKPTGSKVESTLSFVMSPDLKDYAFNALPGQTGNNPDIKVKSGDTVTIHVKNNSKSFHAFGIVVDPDNQPAVLWNSAVKSADSPMKPNESGDVTFVAGAPGTYHYICTVPGHAALGMDGKFIV